MTKKNTPIPRTTVHEIRNVITGINLYAHLLQKSLRKKKNQEYIARITKNVIRLQKLTEEL